MTLESEDVEEFTTQQMIHLLVDEIKGLKTQISKIEDTLVQMNGGKSQ